MLKLLLINKDYNLSTILSYNSVDIKFVSSKNNYIIVIGNFQSMHKLFVEKMSWFQESLNNQIQNILT